MSGSVVEFSERNDWFDLWLQYEKSVVKTMYHNMVDDLDAGRDPLGGDIVKQHDDISHKRFDVLIQRYKLLAMSSDQREHWCYADLLHKGAI